MIVGGSIPDAMVGSGFLEAMRTAQPKAPTMLCRLGVLASWRLESPERSEILDREPREPCINSF